MILESIQFSNVYKISDLQAKLESGYFDDFLKDFAIYVMTEKGFVKINQDKAIDYNISVDLNDYVTKVNGKELSTNDYSNDEKTEVAKIKDKANIGDSYTKSESDNKYVEKENGKRLVSDEELTNLQI